MRRSVLITTPYPTTEETRLVYGISKRRAAMLRKLVEESLAKKGYFGKNGSGSSANGNGAAPKTKRPKNSAATAATSRRRAKTRALREGN